MERLGLRVEQGDEPRTYRLIGELDLATAPEVSEAVKGALQEPGDLTLDLSPLSFIDSSGIRLLLQIFQALEGKGRLVLMHPAAHVLSVFQLMGLANLERIAIVEAPTPS
jgi:anti-sigma B factor antagonist